MNANYPGPPAPSWGPPPPAPRPRRWPYVLLGVVVAPVVLFGGCAALVAGSLPETDTAPGLTEPAPGFDAAAFYAAVQTGMDRAEVVELAGREPMNCIQSEIEGLGVHESCTWGSFTDLVSVSFSDGRVSSKTRL